MESTPNVNLLGRFETLLDLPVEKYDSYVFTTSAEGMPIVILEMTMLGLPIVAPNVGGIGDFIDAGTGWLVDGPDDIEQYINSLREIGCDPGEVCRRVLAAQQRLKDRHSWTHFANVVGQIPNYVVKHADG
jgi:glycosyltransferase involved in cell wall biosynthesis